MPRSGPKIAVVGHPNKGKSSIVATLSHNDEVAISNISGTTVASQAYPFILNGETLYTLFDTPGFQRPRQVLNWLEKNAAHAGDRTHAVQKFIREYEINSEKTGRFIDEVELLKPIVDGAGIIYVVDGSVPYSPEYESEMSILQWTGQPRMALINPIGEQNPDFIAQWRQALGQFFSIVRVFNPMIASARKHIDVLQAYAELDETYRHDIDRAINALHMRSQNITGQASSILAQGVSDILSLTLSAPLAGETQNQTSSLSTAEQTIRQGLQASYKKTLIKKEQSLRERLAQLYAFYHLDLNVAEIDINFPELFDEDKWYLFGLTRKKILSLCVGAGAAAGAVIDAGMLGGSLLIGSLTGSIFGGAAGLFFQSDIDKLKINGIPLSGTQVSIGPVKNIQFAFVVLGRAVEYQQNLAARAHASRDKLEISHDINKPNTWIDRLGRKDQIRLTQVLLKQSQSSYSESNNELVNLIEKIIKNESEN